MELHLGYFSLSFPINLTFYLSIIIYSYIMENSLNNPFFATLLGSSQRGFRLLSIKSLHTHKPPHPNVELAPNFFFIGSLPHPMFLSLMWIAIEKPSLARIGRVLNNWMGMFCFCFQSKWESKILMKQRCWQF